MSSSSSVARLALGAALLTCAAIVSPLSASAAPPPTPPDSSRGKVGAHSLVDTDADPGASCHYGYTVDDGGTPLAWNGLRRVRVRPPIAYARSGKTSQRISWRVVVQALRVPGETWEAYRTSPWHSKRATPAKAAAFEAIRRLTDPWTDAWAARFRVRVQIRWFASDDRQVTGRATLYVHHYRASEGASTWILAEDCQSTTG